MSERITYEDELRSYTGGKPLNLEIGSRDGEAFIRLSMGETLLFGGLMTPGQAREVVEALQQATKDAG